MPGFRVQFLRALNGMTPHTRPKPGHDAAVKSTRAIRGGRRVTMELPLIGQRVPAILLLPADVARPPAALLLHGYGSRKEQMADAVGRSILE